MSSAELRPVIIGLDVGTTGVKAAAFVPGSSWHRVAIREYPLLRPAPGQAVQDPATILNAARDALAECVEALGPGHVLAVSVSAGMHGLMALDADLRPLTPLITWADARARDQAESLRRSGQARALHALTGAPVHPMTPLTKLMWFTHHDPRTCEKARWWVGLKDYLLLWLTGRLVTELSSACGTGLVDMSTRAWSATAVELSGVSTEQLAPILPTTSVLPLAPAPAREVGLTAGTPVVLGAADGPLSNLGTGAIQPGVAGMSVGTSGAVRMVVAEPHVDDDRTLFCYALTDSAWVLGGAISNGGVVVRWAGNALAPDVRAAAPVGGSDTAVLKLAEDAPAGSDGLVMLPHLLPERAPLWDPDLPGAYLGLRPEHTRAHLIRAAVEGVCLQMRLIVDHLAEVYPVESIRATGGVFRSTLWREVMTAVLARPVHVVGNAEGTALGAAALGLFALGRAATLADAVADLTDPDAGQPPEMLPDPRLAAVYDRLYASIPALIGSLGDVAGLFDQTRPPAAGPPAAAGG